jgi:hypothetical protein
MDHGPKTTAFNAQQVYQYQVTNNVTIDVRIRHNCLCGTIISKIGFSREIVQYSTPRTWRVDNTWSTNPSHPSAACRSRDDDNVIAATLDRRLQRLADKTASATWQNRRNQVTNRSGVHGHVEASQNAVNEQVHLGELTDENPLRHGRREVRRWTLIKSSSTWIRREFWHWF